VVNISREVGFVVTEGSNPILLVEYKWSDTKLEKSLRYFKRRLPEADAWQISALDLKDCVNPEGIRVSPALSLLSSLT
jgi:hypothetical protein